MTGTHERRSKDMVISKEEQPKDGGAKKRQKRKRDTDNSARDISESVAAKKPRKATARVTTAATLNQASKQSTEFAEAAPQGLLQCDSSRKARASANDVVSENGDEIGKRRHTGKANIVAEAAHNTDPTSTMVVKSDPRKFRKKLKTEDQPDGKVDGTSSKREKYSGILSKFERTTMVKEAMRAKKRDTTIPGMEADVDTVEPVIAQGLEPLPQPDPAPEQTSKPAYSSLPEWLANPLRAPTEGKSKFSELGIDSDALRILEANGYKEAFAVQSVVLPLLLQGPKQHPGDLCISAATGSGKTLSYTLPLVKALHQLPAPMLRAVVVVPTRELVKQARETCELLAAGSGLRIGSAIGNVAISEEQQSLMRVDPYFSPDIFNHQQQGDLEGDNWANFSLHDYIHESERHGESLYNYVEKRTPNVDILICTPGRLVDHIRHTKGFTLGHLQWLIIDEADRLLNESFQDWVSVVTRSLDSRASSEIFGFSGKFLSSMGFPIQPPTLKKVILSATMTRDISKLDTLRLSNPKMVMVGSEDTVHSDGVVSDNRFALPPSLKEYSIPVADEAEKPLYLLCLLLSHINVTVQGPEDDPSDQASESDDSSAGGSSRDSNHEDSDGSSESDSSRLESASSSDEETGDVAYAPNMGRNTVLIFTKSSEAASRLSRLLSILHPALSRSVGTIVKSNKSSASRRVLTAYRRGKISIIVATDRASRGLDLRSLKHVINYDVPSSVTGYVHRVGRTARAGREGSAWTLVAHREGRWFGTEIAKDVEGKITRSTKVEKMTMKLDDVDDARLKYGSALEILEQEVKTGGKTKG